MANAFDAYQRARAGAMQQGQNMLAMEQAVQKIQRDRALRDILSSAYRPEQAAIPAMPSAPAEGPLMPGAAPLPDYPAQAAVPAQAAGVDMQNALAQMYKGGFGPEAMAIQQKQRQLAGATPSAVNEYQFFSQLPPKEQEQYLTMKRAQQIKKVGGVESIVSPTQPGQVTPLSTPEKETEFASKKAEETKKAQIKAETIAKAQTSLPKAQIQLEQTKGMVSDILSHPGLESSFGKMGVIPAVPGSDKANFQALLSQLQDTTFINNREALKGGGAITDFEGTKAENAALRAGRAQSAKEFKAAMKDYEYWVDRGFKALEKASKGDFSIEEAAPKGQAAPQAAIDYLMKNNTPAIQQQFKAKYGYLP